MLGIHKSAINQQGWHAIHDLFMILPFGPETQKHSLSQMPRPCTHQFLYPSVSKLSKAWKVYRNVYQQLNPTPQGIGDDSDGVDAPVPQDGDFPVLRSLLSQKSSSQHQDFARAAAWQLEHGHCYQLRHDSFQAKLFQSMADKGEHADLVRLVAAPGCGKTVFTVLLTHAMCISDSNIFLSGDCAG